MMFAPFDQEQPTANGISRIPVKVWVRELKVWLSVVAHLDEPVEYCLTAEAVPPFVNREVDRDNILVAVSNVGLG